MKKILIGCVLLLMASSCEQLLLGDDASESPENIFEIFWKDFDAHYALFNVRGKDWDSVYQATRSTIDGTTSDATLWKTFCEMVDYLDDSHIVLYDETEKEIYTSGFRSIAIAKEQFSFQLVRRKYVPLMTQVEGEAELYYGKVIARDIGYIFLGSEDGRDPVGAMNTVMESLKKHKAIIVDLRTNKGGYADYARTVAGVFSDGEHVVATVQTRNGPEHDDFNEKVNEVTRTTGSEQFLKPVIVLTDRATMSSGEYLALHMKSFNHVTLVGDFTAGDFSTVSLRRFLPNGWTYQYSVQMLLLRDGRSLDGVGIEPDVYIRNTKEDLASGHDVVLERALRYLYEMYGIAG